MRAKHRDLRIVAPCHRSPSGGIELGRKEPVRQTLLCARIYGLKKSRLSTLSVMYWSCLRRPCVPVPRVATCWTRSPRGPDEHTWESQSRHDLSRRPKTDLRILHLLTIFVYLMLISQYPGLLYFPSDCTTDMRIADNTYEFAGNLTLSL